MKFDKNFLFVSYIIYILLIFNLVLTYRIPVILPIVALIILCIIPGYLFCLLSGVKATDQYENFLYVIGISIIFDLLFGLVLNTFLPVIGIGDPLSTYNLQISFSLVILLLTLFIFFSGRAPIISFTFPALLKTEKIFLIFGFIILLSVQAGIYLRNLENSSSFLIFSILLIPVLLLFLILFSDTSTKRVYPFIIYIISFSLLMLFALRSNYILGFDSHQEYSFFQTTLTQSIWTLQPLLLPSAALSISILPTVFEKFLNIDPQILFKVLYPLIFSIIPLLIYVIAKKYVRELLALFASCIFMFETIFITSAANSRTILAIFFFAFAILVLCNTELSNTKKRVMLLLFIIGSIFSHYTTAFIFFGVFLSVFILDKIFSRFEEKKEYQPVDLPLLIFFSSAMFFWYGQINNFSTTGVRFILFRLNIFNDLLKTDVDKYVAPGLRLTSYTWYFTKFVQVIIFVLIGLGVLFVLYTWFQKEIQRNKFPRFEITMNRTLFLTGFVCLVILFLIICAPFLFFQYDTGRPFELTLVVLPVFMVIGASNLLNLVCGRESNSVSNGNIFKRFQLMRGYCKSHQVKIVSGILLLLLIPHLLLATGITYQIDRVPSSIILNSPKDYRSMDFGFAYIYDQDAIALQWINLHGSDKEKIISDDYGGAKVLSQINGPRKYRSTLMFLPPEDLSRGDIFITAISEYFHTFRNFGWEEAEINSYEWILHQKNKVYSNGAVLYKRL